MKSTALVLCMAAAMTVHAQTAAKPAAPAAKAGGSEKAPATASAGVVKYPPGKKADPAVKKTLFTLKVQDLKIGAGPEAVPMKIYKVKYTGWRAADGVVFDSWDQHPTPIKDKDGKPEVDADGKPKVGPPEPMPMPVGFGRMIPGFDQGFTGMHVGGIRRIFVPWQLGYGPRTMPDRDENHPGIPAKSDLVFEVELVEMTDPPPPPQPAQVAPPKLPQGIPPGVPGGPAPKPATPPSAAQPATPPPASQPSTPPQP